jgi:hypothetical protein
VGNGEVGYQVNLPISKYGKALDFHFNVGGTFIPHVSRPLPGGGNSPRHDLRAINLGASAFWKPKTNLTFFVEGFLFQFDQIDELGTKGDSTQLFVNPGFRFAVCQLDQVEWVLGTSLPIGLTVDTPEIGVFAYMSIEHGFRKAE